MMMMMNPHAQPSYSSARSSRLLPPKLSSSIILSSPSFLNILPRPGHHHSPATKHYLRKNNSIRSTSSSSKSSVDSTSISDLEAAVIVKAVVTVLKTAANNLDKTFLLELVSAELDHETASEKRSKGRTSKVSLNDTIVMYESEIRIPPDFGDIGAVQVENEHHEEAYIKSIELTGFPNGTSVNVPCNSWTQYSKCGNNQKRIFFTNKSYTPLNTPNGLKKLREEELQLLRGNGEGERKSSERIYDYDTYNDLGDPDKDDKLARPVLGDKDHPYPRRCRTGRPCTSKDPLSEKRSNRVYVPRDEAFAEVKQRTVSTEALESRLKELGPLIKISPDDAAQGFPNFTAIDSLFKKGKCGDMLFETPELLDRDKFSWFSDEEFSRQTLAGLNPYSIQLVTEWPLKSKLDPEIYGSPESLITTALVETEIGGCMSVDQALKTKKLFILDYHDLLMPYVNKVRDVKGTTLYGSRTLFFLTENGTLRPLAIELTRPPIGHKEQWKKVFTPTRDRTGCWLWRIAKAHVCAHDAGYHQLVIHWLRTHCSTEPYIIAANRQLSAMHPIYRLLHPHFRYTMQINALSRQILINAGGTIETCFSPAEYSMELSSTAYDQLWRFDMEALPADLIRRGMAVEDPTAKHGVKLTIEDYPFANDGLILWDAIKKWVGDYVNHYYPDSKIVGSDKELEAWWTEVRTKGHEDKKDEPWWPGLKTPQDLVHILTTIIWVTSGHHAAVNFGQYTYAGYFPNRPTIARSNMPTEDEDENNEMFLKKPEAALLRCFPSVGQAIRVMLSVYALSNHSPDEEYIGENVESSWAENPDIKAAFEEFNGNVKELESIIDERNADKKLKNRVGAGVVPYELLKPFSESGVTGKGVPNSISI